MLDLERGAELVLQGVHLRPHDEPLAVADARDRLEDLVPNWLVLGGQVEQRNRGG